jgi:ergothioneine biosynthesis protein EgtB
MQRLIHGTRTLHTRVVPNPTHGMEKLVQRFMNVRNETEDITKHLEPEDTVVQTMPDVSPTKWHLAHVTWFWETFVLQNDPSFKVYHPTYNYLFNSYYESVGQRYARPQRGFLSRPTVDEVLQYRQYVTDKMIQYMKSSSYDESLTPIIELGINHEQQHQELILMDIKHVFSMNPLKPTYYKYENATNDNVSSMKMIEYEGGVIEIGHNKNGFCFDNELPRHKVYLDNFKISNRLVTCGEYLEFINDGGYKKPEYWLSDAWATIQKEGWEEPLYWRQVDNKWKIFTLNGEKDLNMNEPVVHVSFCK